MHTLHLGPATSRAPFSPHARFNSALEPRPGSQYSPRPLESTQKKTANVKANIKWELNGEKREENIDFPVKSDAYTTFDSLIGKADRKANEQVLKDALEIKIKEYKNK